MKRITGITEGETLTIYADSPKLELKVEQYGDGQHVVIQIGDKHELLGRIIVSADDVQIWQAGELSGPLIEWVGLGFGGEVQP